MGTCLGPFCGLMSVDTDVCNQIYFQGTLPGSLSELPSSHRGDTEPPPPQGNPPEDQ